MSPSKKQTVRVGIDLGTSRSSISTSTGERHVIDSYVGWPADMVARKVLKRDVLVGRDALDNRSMLDLHRPLEDGVVKEGSPKDEQAVRELLAHLLELAGLEAGNGAVHAVVGVPAKALRVNKQHLRQSLSGLVDGLMIVSEPFAVAYGMEALLHTLVVDLGAGTADFCVLRGRLPGDEDQRTLTTAGDWLDEQLAQAIRQRYPEAGFSPHMVREWKERWSFVGEPPAPVEVTVPVEGKPTRIDITEAMGVACEALVPPTVETMLDLVARVDPEYQERVRHNVVLTGGTALIRGLGPRLEQELEEIGGGRVRVVRDPVFVGSDGGLALATDAPDEDWDRLSAGG